MEQNLKVEEAATKLFFLVYSNYINALSDLFVFTRWDLEEQWNTTSVSYTVHKNIKQKRGRGLTVILLLQVTSTARHQTIQDSFTAPGKEQRSDLMPVWFWLRLNGKDKDNA